jgi:hypothetical protein
MIGEIKKVRSLCPKAKNIEVVEINGYEVAVPRRIFNIGDLGIVFGSISLVD